MLLQCIIGMLSVMGHESILKQGNASDFFYCSDLQVFIVRKRYNHEILIYELLIVALGKCWKTLFLCSH